jgi:hypothetical protein
MPRLNRTSIGIGTLGERWETNYREGSFRVGEMGESVEVAMRLFGLSLEVGDQVVAVLGLLETTKGHLGARDVLLGVL